MTNSLHRLAWMLVLTSLTVGCSSLPTPLPPQQAQGDYRTQLGDQFEFTYYSSQDRTAEETKLNLVVQPDGKVMFPVVGAVRVVGLTSVEILEEINRRLEQKFKANPPIPHFSINVYAHRMIQVLGMVRSPGHYELRHGMRASDALAVAGDLFRPMANPNRSVLIRRSTDAGGDPITYPIYFYEIYENGDPATNYALEPGDLIYVPPTPFRRAAFFIEDLLSPVAALLSPILGPVSLAIYSNNRN